MRHRRGTTLRRLGKLIRIESGVAVMNIRTRRAVSEALAKDMGRVTARPGLEHTVDLGSGSMWHKFTAGFDGFDNMDEWRLG